VVQGSVPYQQRGHPARRTFQAVRIWVNRELESIEQGLNAAIEILPAGGRCVAISYHSLEDRLVKQRLALGSRGCVCPPDLPVCGCGKAAELALLTRRALRPQPDEVVSNPRARSARLRAAEKVAA
jgi:16S rRNA (cytosine1402-N4)-methyltransferase